MKSYLLRYIHALYVYYNSGSNKSIAYESALLAFALVILLHLYLAVAYFNLIEYLSFFSEYSRGIQYILFALFVMLPLYFLMNIIFKKSEVINYVQSRTQVRIHLWITFTYSAILLFLIIFLAKMNRPYL